MKFKAVGLLIAMCSVIVGCATIVSGTTQQVTFQSTPDDATVKVNGRPLGKTPLTIQLDKEDGMILTVEKEGYQTFTTSMDTSLDPWFWGNVIIGGLIGSTTDGISGAINEYSPGQYIITLQPAQLSHSGSTMHLSQRESAKRFLFINYSKLKQELSLNSGEVVDAALEVLNVDSNDYETVKGDIKGLMFSQKDPADFVNIALDTYFTETKS